MTFLELYGEALSRELGSSDTVALFTEARRKAAINLAQTWFIVQTECLVVTAEIALVDGTAEYDLEVEIDDDQYVDLAKRYRPYIACAPASGSTTYLDGDQFLRRSIAWLDKNVPGWRGTSAGTPEAWYEASEGGGRIFGLYAAPDIPAGATWTLHVPYVVLAADMVSNDDEPFTSAANPKRSMRPWHDALAYYAASELEKLRKGTERSTYLRQMAEARVLDYMDKQRVPGGKTVQVARAYRREAGRRRGFMSDYGPYDDPYK